MSVILMSEVVENKKRKEGEPLEFVPVKVVSEDGHEAWALFTEDEIINATDRARTNPEDVPGNGG